MKKNLAIRPQAPAVSGRGEKVEIVFSFDTTGSMYPCLAEVRRKLTEVITRLKRDVPGIRRDLVTNIRTSV
jgi:hypothetical protein